MSEKSTLDLVVESISENLDDKDKNLDESTAIEDLGLDSLEMMEVVMSLEEKTNAKIEDSEISSLKTVGDIVEIIDEKLANA